MTELERLDAILAEIDENIAGYYDDDIPEHQFDPETIGSINGLWDARAIVSSYADRLR